MRTGNLTQAAAFLSGEAAVFFEMNPAPPPRVKGNRNNYGRTLKKALKGDCGNHNKGEEQKTKKAAKIAA
ncbi:MAG: hypothetical protein ACE5EK_09565 [Nitrospinales bacterium]